MHTPVDGIRVHDHVAQLEDDAAHVLLGERTLLAGPLHGGVTAVLDLIQVLHALGDVDKQVGAVGVGAEAPNLLGQVLVPGKVLSEDLGAGLGVVTGTDLRKKDDGEKGQNNLNMVQP